MMKKRESKEIPAMKNELRERVRKLVFRLMSNRLKLWRVINNYRRKFTSILLNNDCHY